ncbi:hypothetical protein [Psychroflexus sp. ALD_RP9]|uniref:hypothetical protein n=1 Tax=Psychroflexus sp. ALD_RP9 TaxID=2777186 RepID=UPI001A8DF699|nr:hypothetical protein [Psychroflexus sp. ALD_RP9]QSS96649.1 hypothetical protein IMZ30_09370 [Psychroflexus sp. ALD_RP9]
MNLYIIVEGRRTEKKVYPAWLSHLIPRLSPVNWAYQVDNNNYFLFNGNGFPALLHNHLKNSIEEVNELKKFNYLVLVLDVDESTVDGRINEVNEFLAENNLELNPNTELVIIPQNRCIESWFLGNQKVFKQNPQNSDLVKYIQFYNVKTSDPEEMGVYPNFNTHSQFHADYCTEFLRERNIRYSKNRPNGVVDKDYLESLIIRNQETSHIESFKLFLDFCEKINSEI